MASLSTILTLLIGPTLPVPASPDAGGGAGPRGGHRLRPRAVRLPDRLLGGPVRLIRPGRLRPAQPAELRPFSRVLLLVAFGGPPKVLIDGVITHRELLPGDLPGNGTLTVTGEDVSVMMDLEEKNAEHPAQAENTIAAQLIGSYPTYGLIPQVTTPSTGRHADHDRTGPGAARYRFGLPERDGGPVRLRLLRDPGPAQMSNTVYWGPPVRSGPPQRALTVDMGVETNVEQISFRANALAPTKVRGVVQDRSNNQVVSVTSSASLRAPLSAQPDWQTLPATRTTLTCGSGLTATQAQARAQGTADASTDSVTATGTLDALRYGDLLTARGLVELRGAGLDP